MSTKGEKTVIPMEILDRYQVLILTIVMCGLVNIVQVVKELMDSLIFLQIDNH